MAKKKQPGVGGGAALDFVTSKDVSEQSTTREERNRDTVKLVQEFFADPVNARLLEVNDEDEVSGRDLPGAQPAVPAPTKAEVDEARERVRAEYLRRRKARGAEAD